MIKKIISIKNVGRFVNYSAPGNVEFRRLTLLYGENGQGKTMLSALLRSMRLNEPKYLEERRTIGAIGPPEVSVKTDAGVTNFKSGIWDNPMPEMEIFDTTFVDENVFSGSYVDHEHKKSVYRFIVGEQGVNLAKQVDTLDEKIRTKNADMDAKKRQIQPHVVGKLDVEKFVQLPQVPDVDLKIEAKAKEVAAIKDAYNIASKSALQTISLPAVSVAELTSLLSKSLLDVSLDAEELMRAHIASCMDGRGETWVSQGLSYIKEDTCPFCGQSLEGLGLIEAYHAHFSDAYSNFKAQIASFRDAVGKAFSGENLLPIQKTVDANKHLAEFWKNYVEADYPDIGFQDIKNACDSLRNQLDQHLNRKAMSPLEPIQIGESLESAMTSFQSVQTIAAGYNQGVDGANKLIAAKKQKTAQSSLTQAEDEHAHLQNSKGRFASAIKLLCSEFQAMVTEKSQLEDQKRKAKESLDGYAEKVLQTYEKAMNQYLQNFGAGFRICQAKTSYVGGKPRWEYRLSINQKAIDLGDSKTSGVAPCFKNTLSAGDKSTLAFAFFLARVEKDPNLGNKVIIFDDPISSLDVNRKCCTQQGITRIAQKAKQTVVLSHDAYFLLSIWDENDQAEVKPLYLARAGQQSTIAEWDIEASTRNDYLRDWFALDEYLAKGYSGDVRDVARCIRPVLEGSLRMRFPKQFGKREMLGKFINKIGASKAGDPLVILQPQLTELTELNGYSKKYQHNENPNASSEPIQDGALRPYVERTLKFVSGT